MAIEITVSNKRSDEMTFKYLPDYFKNIILTKDVTAIRGDKQYIPYHEFIKNYC